MKLAALSGRLSGALVALTLCLTAACATPSSQEVAVGPHRVVDTGHYGSESLRVTLSDPFEGCEWQASSQGFACEGVGFSFGNVDDTAPFDSLLIALLGGLEAATGTELETSIDRLDSLPEGAELARLKNPEFEGLYYAHQTDSIQFATCLGKVNAHAMERCEAMLLAALDGGLPEVATAPPPEEDPGVGPHDMMAWDGCTYDVANRDHRVECPGGLLIWQRRSLPQGGLDWLWEPIRMAYDGDGLLEFTEASCRFHETESDSCRAIRLYDSEEDRTYSGSISFVRFGADVFAIHCFTARPDEDNICSINGISVESTQTP